MLVTDIQITPFDDGTGSSGTSARVCMTSDNQVVTLLCRIGTDQKESPVDAFVAEATRQMQRMPEFRSGRVILRFAENLRSGARLEPANSEMACPEFA